MIGARILELMAMVMIGDGVLALLQPEHHVSLWRGGPRAYQRLVDKFARHAGVTRVLGAVEAAFGIFLAVRQYNQRVDSS